MNEPTKPEGMSKTQWLKEQRSKRRLKREEEKQKKLDWDLYLNSPLHTLEAILVNL